jgi:hypothetical protein
MGNSSVAGAPHWSWAGKDQARVAGIEEIFSEWFPILAQELGHPVAQIGRR